ncbi:hypothetical protein TL16_g12987 [Triparma laevis f. inornata]|uniref:SSD domain-containing protein n=1 Tax=Triparma laevis f. inornata TaxID=1714386 RepID=A0A9W7EW37_9STRA|nr:hypothetical protein TL16_g12987 [Triparma laevis f. inornata]
MFVSSSRARLLDCCSSKFGDLGDLIERRPWLVILVSSLIAILFGMGAGGVNLETEGVYLWIPTTSETYTNFLSYNDAYQAGAKLNFLNFIIAAEDGGSILRKEILAQVVDLHHNVTVDFVSPKGESFQDHCFKSSVSLHGVSSPCSQTTFLQLFGYSDSGIPASESDILSEVNTANSVSSVASALGGLTYSDPSSTVISGASTMIMAYTLKNLKASQLDYETYIIKQTLPDKLKELYPDLTIQRLSSQAFDEEVKKLVVDDMPLFMGAIYIIIIFLALTFGPLTRAKNRVLLSFVALPQVILSLMFATGCQGFFGAKISTLNFLIGFILAGVGVDDMIVVEEFYARAKAKNSKSVMRDTLSEGGMAVFLTSFTAVVAFLVGAFVDLPAVRSFCVCAGLAFGFNFVMNVTFFPAFLFLDESRCCFPSCCSCCIGRAHEDKSTPNDNDDKEKDEVVVVEKPPSLVHSFFKNIICPALEIPAVQALVLLVTFGAAAGSLAYGLDIEVGLSVTEVVPDSSYAVTFFDTLEEKFTSQVKIMCYSAENIDYSSSSDVGKLTDLFDDIEAIDTVLGRVGRYGGHWLLHYQAYLTNNGKDPYTNFGESYTDFLESSTCNSMPCDVYAMDVIGTIESGELKSVDQARFFFEEVSLTETSEVWKVYTKLKSLQASHGLSGYYFIELFMYAENDSLMFMYLFRSLGVTLIAVAGAMFAFTDTASTIYITLCVMCIDCHLLGFARVWDTRLNSVLFTTFIMSVGLSVDYCVHIAHAYVHAEEKHDPTKRLKEALMSLGPAVFKGGFTTLLGVCLLSMASSSVFRMFFKMLFLTVIFGVLHGVISLPVFLCLHQKFFSPSSPEKGDKDFEERVKMEEDNKL